jgi:hypothetical protein
MLIDPSGQPLGPPNFAANIPAANREGLDARAPQLLLLSRTRPRVRLINSFPYNPLRV